MLIQILILILLTNTVQTGNIFAKDIKSNQTRNKGLKGIISGGITGAIEISITYPTEFVKTQLQLDKKEIEQKYDGIVDCVKQTVREHGFCGLYKGITVLLYGTIPKTAVRFGVFEICKIQLVGNNGTLNMFGRVVCGLTAGVFEAILVVTPAETIKVKLIDDQRSETPRFTGFCQGVILIISEEGIRGIYKGVTATVLRQGTNQAVRFFVVETLKGWYRGDDPDKKVSSILTAIFGGIAGAVSVYVNNPIDVVKTRMQGLHAESYKNTCDCIVKICKNEGFFAFYKGALARMSRVCIDVAIVFSVYDIVMDLIDTLWP